MHLSRRDLLALLLALAATGCPSSSAGSGRQPGDGADWTPPEVPEADAKAAAAALNQFGIDLHRELGKAEGDVFFSPASIAAALGMTWGGAKGATADQLAKALHLTLAPDKAHPALGGLLAAQQAQDDPVLEVADRLWGAQGEFRPEFLALTRDAYGAELAQVDFRSDPEAARKRINGWVAERTRDRIQDLVPAGVIDALTRLVLTNAVYFKGSWATRFDEARSFDGRFTLASGAAADGVRFMRDAKLPARVFQGEGFTLGELPYTGDRLSMVVLVPEKPDGLPALEAKLSADALGQWLASSREAKVDVVLPRFRIERPVSLRPALEALGVTDAFLPGQADLSGMAGAPGDLFIQAALHEAFVEVTEEGTEAAAATAVVVGVRSEAAPNPELHATHPFLFLIRDRQTGLILFLGRETDPRS